jgi:hypothetical protein
MTMPTVKDNPEAFDTPANFVAQQDLPASMGNHIRDVYCPNCLRFKLNHPVQPWKLENCTSNCGTCHMKHAPGFCPQRYCLWSYYQALPRLPFVGENIKIQPNPAQIEQLEAAGIAKFSWLQSVNEARGKKRHRDMQSQEGANKVMKQELGEQEQRVGQYAAGMKLLRQQHAAEVAQLNARIKELEGELRHDTHFEKQY